LNLAAAKSVAALGRSVGTVVRAAELLYKLRNRDLKSDEMIGQARRPNLPSW